MLVVAAAATLRLRIVEPAVGGRSAAAAAAAGRALGAAVGRTVLPQELRPFLHHAGHGRKGEGGGGEGREVGVWKKGGEGS